MSNIIYTKVKFIRNLKGKKFESNIYDNEQKDVLKLSLEAINSCGLKCALLSEVNKNIIGNLLANDLIEQDFVAIDSNKGFANKDNVTVQINNKNHIEIFAKDTNIYDAYSQAKQIDKLLCNKLNFAYSDKYGFLAPNIKDIGSGMSVETQIMLPALAQIDALNKLPKMNEKLTFDITCIDRQSGLCVITTSGSLGYTEKQICELTKTYMDHILKLEIETSKKLAEGNDDIEDKCCRAKAILKNCIKISGAEAYILLGNILVSLNAGIEKEVSIKQIITALNCIKLYENNFKQLAQELQKILK